MNDYRLLDLWRLRHMFCTDTPPPMPLAEALYVQKTHDGHGSACLQFAAAQRDAEIAV